MDKPNPIDDTVLSPDGDSSLVATATKTFPIANWERYEFIRLLGQGGMGAVYLARDPRLGRLIALKFIRNIDAHTTLRFMQEARAQARIDHPDICKISGNYQSSDGIAQSCARVIPFLILRFPRLEAAPLCPPKLRSAGAHSDPLHNCFSFCDTSMLR